MAAFPNKFSYAKCVYRGEHLRTVLTCKVHGDITMTPAEHLGYKLGCKACGRSSVGASRRRGNAAIIAALVAKHGDTYDLSKVTTDVANSTVEVGCRVHGWVTTSLKNMLKGQRPCRQCKGKNISDSKKQQGIECLLRAIENSHRPQYTYDVATFTTYSSDIRIICPRHGEFWQNVGNHFAQRQGCPSCGTSRSLGEVAVAEYLAGLGVAVETRNRRLLAPFEVDIYLPEFKVGVEYNGVYWHADDLGRRGTMRNKWELANAAGIRLIQIFDDEWITRRPAVEGLLRSAVRKAGSIGARRLIAATVTPSVARDFLELHHLQGFLGARYHYGLFLGQELYAVASFGASRFETGITELIRYASSCNIAGGLRKLIKHAGLTRLTSYCDMRHGTGQSYLHAGFASAGITPADYWWFKGTKRYARYECQKHRLKTHLDFAEHYADAKTERQICEDAGFRKISGVGHLKFIFTV